MKPLADAVRIYVIEDRIMADIRTAPGNGSTLETIHWTNPGERKKYEYNGYTLFFDERTKKSKLFSEIRWLIKLLVIIKYNEQFIFLYFFFYYFLIKERIGT